VMGFGVQGLFLVCNQPTPPKVLLHLCSHPLHRDAHRSHSNTAFQIHSLTHKTLTHTRSLALWPMALVMAVQHSTGSTHLAAHTSKPCTFEPNSLPFPSLPLFSLVFSSLLFPFSLLCLFLPPPLFNTSYCMNLYMCDCVR
jgi:hypothetical protein